MAHTYGILRGGRGGQATKVGGDYIEASAQTYQTFATVTVWKDGRVILEVRDDSGLRSLIVELSAEAGTEPRTVTTSARVEGRMVERAPFAVDR